MDIPRAAYFTTQQVGELVGVSVRTVAAWVDGGKLPAHRTAGGHRRIPRHILIDFMRRAGMAVPPEELPHTGTRPRVLVVDDNHEFLDVLGMFLESHGLDVRCAVNGFLAGIEAARFTPDLVLVDLRMPGMDGFEVARVVRSQFGSRPPTVVAMTGYAEPALADKAEAAGFALVLHKPFDLDRMMTEIERLLESRGIAQGVSAA
jgi:excisionase family DNA binding protein